MLVSSITTLAWLVKPLIGYLIDNFLNKRAWVFISLAIDIALVLVAGLFSLPFAILLGILVFISASAAFRDVAADGVMCVEGKARGLTGKIQSVQWVSISAALLFTGIGGGAIAEKWGYRAAFLFLIPIYILAGAAAYFFTETPAGGAKSAGLIPDLKKLFAHKNLLVVSLFIFLYKYAPSFGTPLFFIQRDNFGWSKTWIGALTTIGTLFTVFGALLYYRFSQKINIKKWLYYSVFFGAVTTLSYLYYTPPTAIAYDIIYSLLGMFIFLMVMDFMARNTINGLEATSFAFLCSVSNLALVASSLSGAILLPRLGLKWLIVISSATSFFCLPLIKKIK